MFFPYFPFIKLVASGGKRNATAWRLSVCLSGRHTHRGSLGSACDAASVHFGPTITRTDVRVGFELTAKFYHEVSISKSNLQC